jgi:hypothetical protein
MDDERKVAIVMALIAIGFVALIIIAYMCDKGTGAAYEQNPAQWVSNPSNPASPLYWLLFG